MQLIKLTTILLILSSCAKVPNVELCGRIPNQGARCGFTVEGPKRNITEKKWNQWEQSNLGMVCTDATGWGEIKRFILKMCKQNENCKHRTDVRSHIDELEKRLGLVK